MPQRASQDRPFRARNLALVGGLIAVTLAARSQQPAQAPAKAPAPAPAATPATAPADSTTVAQDSTAQDSTAMPDSMAMMMNDSSHADMHAVHMAAAEAPAPAPTAWPVDPATGQTLINGEPVVGKVFIMQKTDGTKKVETIAQDLAGEPGTPAAATVGSTNAPTTGSVRRMRGVMIQATLWLEDHKKSAVRHRHYPSTTTGAALGQQY